MGEERAEPKAQDLARNLVRAGWWPVQVQPTSGRDRTFRVLVGAHATPTDAQLSMHYVALKSNQVVSRTPEEPGFDPNRLKPSPRKTLLSVRPLDSMLPDGLTTQAIPSAHALGLSRAWTLEEVTPFKNLECPIRDGGQRDGSQIKPNDGAWAGSLGTLEAELKAKRAPPEAALSRIREYLLAQKDVRPVLGMLADLAYGRVAASPDTRYQAAWLLARAHHARADRLSALLIYTQIIQASPHAQDRARAWAERTGLMIELKVDDGQGTEEDWLGAAGQALKALQGSDDQHLKARATVEWMVLVHFGSRNSSLEDWVRVCNQFIARYESHPSAWREVSSALLSQGITLTAMKHPEGARESYRRILETEREVEDEYPNLPIRKRALKYLMVLEQDADQMDVVLELAKKSLKLESQIAPETPEQRELGFPGVGKFGPGSLPRVMEESVQTSPAPTNRRSQTREP